MSENKNEERKTKEKKKPFGNFNEKMEEVNENIKDGFKQIGSGFATFFGVKKEPFSQQQISPGEKAEFQLQNTPSHDLQESYTEHSFQNAWERFVSDANQNFEKMKNQTQEIIRKNNENFKGNMEKIDGFFKEKREEFDSKLIEIQEEMKRKDNERKEAWKLRTERVNEDFQQFLQSQQKDFKKGVKRFNRLGWSMQWRCIIWLIPVIIVIFVLLYALVFFQGIIPGL